MKKNIITISCFLIIFFLQKTVHAQLVDGVTFIPANLQFITSPSKNASLLDTENTLGFSAHPQILFQKELNANLDLFGGVGYAYFLEGASIRKNLSSFSRETGVIWSNISEKDTSFEIKSINYSNDYLTIPLGFRFYSEAKDNHGIKMTLSSKIDFGFLLKSHVNVPVRTYDTGFFGSLIPIRVENTVYEKDAIAFFKEKNRTFMMNIQIGMGYEFRAGKHFSFGNEFVLGLSPLENKKDLFGKRRAIGMQLRLVYHVQ